MFNKSEPLETYPSEGFRFTGWDENDVVWTLEPVPDTVKPVLVCSVDRAKDSNTAKPYQDHDVND